MILVYEIRCKTVQSIHTPLDNKRSSLIGDLNDAYFRGYKERLVLIFKAAEYPRTKRSTWHYKATSILDCSIIENHARTDVNADLLR